jgi:tetratricopeptide (TPR) repeat protein
MDYWEIHNHLFNWPRSVVLLTKAQLGLLVPEGELPVIKRVRDAFLAEVAFRKWLYESDYTDRLWPLVATNTSQRFQEVLGELALKDRSVEGFRRNLKKIEPRLRQLAGGAPSVPGEDQDILKLFLRRIHEVLHCDCLIAFVEGTEAISIPCKISSSVSIQKAHDEDRTGLPHLSQEMEGLPDPLYDRYGVLLLCQVGDWRERLTGGSFKLPLLFARNRHTAGSSSVINQLNSLQYLATGDLGEDGGLRKTGELGAKAILAKNLGVSFFVSEPVTLPDPAKGLVQVEIPISTKGDDCVRIVEKHVRSLMRGRKLRIVLSACFVAGILVLAFLSYLRSERMAAQSATMRAKEAVLEQIRYTRSNIHTAPPSIASTVAEDLIQALGASFSVGDAATPDATLERFRLLLLAGDSAFERAETMEYRPPGGKKVAEEDHTDYALNHYSTVIRELYENPDFCQQFSTDAKLILAEALLGISKVANFRKNTDVSREFASASADLSKRLADVGSAGSHKNQTGVAVLRVETLFHLCSLLPYPKDEVSFKEEKEWLIEASRSLAFLENTSESEVFSFAHANVLARLGETCFKLRQPDEAAKFLSGSVTRISPKTLASSVDYSENKDGTTTYRDFTPPELFVPNVELRLDLVAAFISIGKDSDALFHLEKAQECNDDFFKRLTGFYSISRWIRMVSEIAVLYARLGKIDYSIEYLNASQEYLDQLTPLLENGSQPGGGLGRKQIVDTRLLLQLASEPLESALAIILKERPILLKSDLQDGKDRPSDKAPIPFEPSSIADFGGLHYSQSILKGDSRVWLMEQFQRRLDDDYRNVDTEGYIAFLSELVSLSVSEFVTPTLGRITSEVDYDRVYPFIERIKKVSAEQSGAMSSAEQTRLKRVAIYIEGPFKDPVFSGFEEVGNVATNWDDKIKEARENLGIFETNNGVESGNINVKMEYFLLKMNLFYNLVISRWHTRIFYKEVGALREEIRKIGRELKADKAFKELEDKERNFVESWAPDYSGYGYSYYTPSYEEISRSDQTSQTTQFFWGEFNSRFSKGWTYRYDFDPNSRRYYSYRGFSYGSDHLPDSVVTELRMFTSTIIETLEP